MGTSSGQVIIGVAKDNEQAKADFEQAIKHGRKTALVEWAADDSELNNVPDDEHSHSKKTKFSPSRSVLSREENA